MISVVFAGCFLEIGVFVFGLSRFARRQTLSDTSLQ